MGNPESKVAISSTPITGIKAETSKRINTETSTTFRQYNSQINILRRNTCNDLINKSLISNNKSTLDLNSTILVTKIRKSNLKNVLSKKIFKLNNHISDNVIITSINSTTNANLLIPIEILSNNENFIDKRIKEQLIKHAVSANDKLNKSLSTLNIEVYKDSDIDLNNLIKELSNNNNKHKENRNEMINTLNNENLIENDNLATIKINKGIKSIPFDFKRLNNNNNNSNNNVNKTISNSKLNNSKITDKNQNSPKNNKSPNKTSNKEKIDGNSHTRDKTPTKLNINSKNNLTKILIKKPTNKNYSKSPPKSDLNFNEIKFDSTKHSIIKSNNSTTNVFKIDIRNSNSPNKSLLNKSNINNKSKNIKDVNVISNNETIDSNFLSQTSKTIKNNKPFSNRETIQIPLPQSLKSSFINTNQKISNETISSHFGRNFNTTLKSNNDSNKSFNTTSEKGSYAEIMKQKQQYMDVSNNLKINSNRSSNSKSPLRNYNSNSNNNTINNFNINFSDKYSSENIINKRYETIVNDKVNKDSNNNKVKYINSNISPSGNAMFRIDLTAKKDEEFLDESNSSYGNNKEMKELLSTADSKKDKLKAKLEALKRAQKDNNNYNSTSNKKVVFNKQEEKQVFVPKPIFNQNKNLDIIRESITREYEDYNEGIIFSKRNTPNFDDDKYKEYLNNNINNNLSDKENSDSQDSSSENYNNKNNNFAANIDNYSKYNTITRESAEFGNAEKFSFNNQIIKKVSLLEKNKN